MFDLERIKKKYDTPEIDIEEATNGGNRYSLPYGLCKSVGINTEGMTPREAWEAWQNKTGKTKEEAEKEHWGKTADEKQPQNENSKENTSESVIKSKEDIKTKDDLISYIKHRHGVELKNENIPFLNDKKNRLYTEIPKENRNAILNDLKQQGFSVEEHDKGYYWIDLPKKKEYNKTLKGEKTIENAVKKAKNFAETVSYNGVKNIDSLNKINESYENLSKKYNLEKLESIGVDTRTDPWARAIGGRHLRISKSFLEHPESKKVRRSTTEYTKFIDDSIKKYNEAIDSIKDQPGRAYKNYIKNATEQIKQLEEDRKYSRHNVVYGDDEIRSVVTHEVGHLLAEQRFQHSSRSYADYGNTQKIRKAFEQAKENGDIYKISKYASKSPQEFFAECFTMYELGKEELPTNIKNVIEEVLNQKQER